MMLNESDVTNVRELATQAHLGQLYGNDPYIVHLDEVAKIVYKYANVARTVAYLHDILEDTQITDKDIEEWFGDKVLRNVQLCTDEPGGNRKTRKIRTNLKLSNASIPKYSVGLTVKAADRLANARRCVMNNPKLLTMYAGEYPEFKKAAYRPGLCDEIWAELDGIFYGEIDES